MSGQRQASSPQLGPGGAEHFFCGGVAAWRPSGQLCKSIPISLLFAARTAPAWSLGRGLAKVVTVVAPAIKHGPQPIFHFALPISPRRGFRRASLVHGPSAPQKYAPFPSDPPCPPRRGLRNTLLAGFPRSPRSESHANRPPRLTPELLAECERVVSKTIPACVAFHKPGFIQQLKGNTMDLTMVNALLTMASR